MATRKGENPADEGVRARAVNDRRLENSLRRYRHRIGRYRDETIRGYP